MKNIQLQDIYRGKTAVITKIKDTKFNGLHPNGIYEGYQQIGEITQGCVGDMLLLERGYFVFNTSTITSINEAEVGHEIHTINSIYHLREATPEEVTQTLNQ